jgi:hypothetical protein
MTLDIGSELTEGIALVTLGSRLRDLEELDDAAAQSLCELGQAGFLVLEAEALYDLIAWCPSALESSCDEYADTRP